MRFSTRLGARERCLGCLSITISYSTILLQDIGKKKARKKLRQHSLALLSLTLGNPKQRSCENEKQITVYCMMICLGAHRWILCSEPLEKKFCVPGSQTCTIRTCSGPLQSCYHMTTSTRAAFGLSSSAIYECPGIPHIVPLCRAHRSSSSKRTSRALHRLAPGATHQLFDEMATTSIWSRTALIIEYDMQWMTSLLASSFS
jgi:hypothetical protein